MGWRQPGIARSRFEMSLPGCRPVRFIPDSVSISAGEIMRGATRRTLERAIMSSATESKEDLRFRSRKPAEAFR